MVKFDESEQSTLNSPIRELFGHGNAPDLADCITGNLAQQGKPPHASVLTSLLKVEW